MPPVYNTPTVNDRLQQVVNHIDAGAGNGLLKIGTIGMGTILATVVLAKPCATVANRVLTFVGVPLTDISAAGVGNAVEAQITDSTGTVVIDSLTVGNPAGDMVISQILVDSGDIVAFVSGQIVGT